MLGHSRSKDAKTRHAMTVMEHKLSTMSVRLAAVHDHTRANASNGMQQVFTEGRELFNQFIKAAIKNETLPPSKLNHDHPFYATDQFLRQVMTFNPQAVDKMTTAYKMLHQTCLEEYEERIQLFNVDSSSTPPLDNHQNVTSLSPPSPPSTERSPEEVLLEVYLSITKPRKPHLAAWCAQGMLQFVSYPVYVMVNEHLRHDHNKTLPLDLVTKNMKMVSEACNLMLLWNCLLDDYADNVGLPKLCKALKDLTYDLATDASGKENVVRVPFFSEVRNNPREYFDNENGPKWALKLKAEAHHSQALFGFAITILDFADEAFKKARTMIGGYNDSSTNQVLWDRLLNALEPLGQCMVDAANFNESATPFTDVLDYFTPLRQSTTLPRESVPIDFIESFSANMMVELIAWLTIAGLCKADEVTTNPLKEHFDNFQLVIKYLQRASRLGNNVGSYDRELGSGDLTNLLFMICMVDGVSDMNRVQNMLVKWDDRSPGVDSRQKAIERADLYLSKIPLRKLIRSVINEMKTTPLSINLRDPKLFEQHHEEDRAYQLLSTLPENRLRDYEAEVDSFKQQKKVWGEFFDLKCQDRVARDESVVAILSKWLVSVNEVLNPGDYPAATAALRVSFLELIMHYIVAQAKGES